MDSLKLSVNEKLYYMSGADFQTMLKTVKKLPPSDRAWDEYARAWIVTASALKTLGERFTISDNRDAISAANKREFAAKRADEQRKREAQWEAERHQKQAERDAQRREYEKQREAERQNPALREARHNSTPATQKQLDYMDALGVRAPEGCTIAQASSLIETAKAKAAQRFAPHGQRWDEECERCRRVTVVCNDCGCCERHCDCGSEKVTLDRETAEMIWQGEEGAMREAGWGAIGGSRGMRGE